MQNKQKNGGCRSRLGCLLRALLFIAIGFGAGAYVVSHDLNCQRIFADHPISWVTPDYYNANGWTDPGNAMDDNTNTYAYYTTPDETWSPWFYLYLDHAIEGDRVRYNYSFIFFTTIQISVYYSDGWHTIYSGAPSTPIHQWYTYMIGSTQSVTGMRIRGYCDSPWGTSGSAIVHEADFYGHFPPTELDTNPESDTNYTETNHELITYVTDAYGEPVPDVALTWDITSGPGYWIDYDDETDAGGYAYATLYSPNPGQTWVKCLCTDYPSVWDNVYKNWVYPPDELTLEPESDLNFWGDEHTLNATVYDEINDPLPGFDVTWSIESGPGWFVDYDESTDESGSAYAIITANSSGVTTIKCAADGFPDVYDMATKQWKRAFWPVTMVLIPEHDTNYIGTNHTITAIIYDQNDDALPAMAVNWSIESGQGCFVFSENITDSFGQAKAVIASNVTGNTTIRCITNDYDYPNINATAIKIWEKGGVTMPIWYILGLAILAAGAWWSKSTLVNIMVMAMAGAGIPLMDEALEAGTATYWGIYLILILAVFYALIQIFTRVEHW